MRIAVVGSGVSGLSAAWLLAPEHEVTLYERNPSLGGHTHTVDVDWDGTPLAVDTGFIVYNEVNYPNLTEWFRLLAVETQDSDMSFAVSCDQGGFEYGGTARQLLAQPGNLLRPRFHRMLWDLLRFYRQAPAVLETEDSDTLGGYLTRHGYSEAFVRDHLLPMGAAIWSCPARTMLEFPVVAFVRFCCNHGLLSLTARPQWRSVVGGGRQYVQRAAARLQGRIRLSAPIHGIRRTEAGVFLREADGAERFFDRVILACHADEALALLTDADSEERGLLGAFRYQRNDVVLHRDAGLMPCRRAVWSSWNYLSEVGAEDRRVAVTYWMNRLQAIDERYPLFVSLNPLREPAEGSEFGRWSYDHPVFDKGAMAAQQRIGEIQGRGGIWYCGAHLGFGFHEDGLRSAIAVARAFGATIPWASEVEPASMPDADRRRLSG